MSRHIAADRLMDLATPDTGLAVAAVAQRRSRYGANEIGLSGESGWLGVLGDSARDPMLWFLFGTAVLFAWTGDRVEATVLFLALVPLLLMDAWLHRRTRASMASLGRRLAATAQVLRDGSWSTCPARDLVPGDLVRVAPGDWVPADGLLRTAEQLQVDESTLTGESLPVRKSALGTAIRAGVPIEDDCWLGAGTRVLSGRAELLVTHTGASTWYGSIVDSAVRGRREATPLQRAVARLVRTLVIAALFSCIVLAWVRVEQGHGMVDALLAAVTLAIAALPEEFPVVLAVFLGVGSYRLARRRALARRAAVVENIGRVSCICTDKTGTLTEGRLRVAHLLPVREGDSADLIRLAGLASRMDSGDPMDVAILDAQADASADASANAPGRLATFPFTEDRRRETTILSQPDGNLAVVKGAPEVVLSMSELEPHERARWLSEVEELAAGGHKVIAVAACAMAGGSEQEPDQGFSLAGLLAFEDPVRPGVADALAACRDVGIRVVMVTGDHPRTALAVARELALGAEEPVVIDGDEMAARLATDGAAALAGVDVVARAMPTQKLQLVAALQAAGETVAVTGDGVNDVPALRAADIGIAMGGRGTQSAREVAAIVLLDDDFGSIVAAIAEGRQLFRNLQACFRYLLMIHLPLVFTAAVIPLAGFPLLYLPVHIVWLELVIHPTALLVFQGLPAAGLQHEQRQRDTLRFFDRRQWWWIMLTGASITLLVMASFVRSLGADYSVEHARSMALAMLVMASTGLTVSITRLRGRFAPGVIAATLLGSIWLIQWPPVAMRLHLAPLHFDDWLLAFVGAVVVGLMAVFGGPARASIAPSTHVRALPPRI